MTSAVAEAVVNMAGNLKRLFDYQRFEGNKRLQKLIDETEARSGEELSDDMLGFVAAAGDLSQVDRDQEQRETRSKEL